MGGQELDGSRDVLRESGLGVEAHLVLVGPGAAFPPEMFRQEKREVVRDLLVGDPLVPQLDVLDEAADRAVSLAVESGDDYHGSRAGNEKILDLRKSERKMSKNGVFF